MLDEVDIRNMTNAGHTLHPTRSTYTHAAYAAELGAISGDTEIKERGVPIYVAGLERNLMVSDCLPERVVLCLDPTGEIIGQNDFKERYQNYLRGFHTTRTIEYEPVPNVKSWLMQKVDPTKPPTDGRVWYVEIGFNPGRDVEPKETGQWSMDGIKIDEWKKANPELAQKWFGEPSQEQSEKIQRDAKVEMLLEMQRNGEISSDAFQKRLAALYGSAVDIVSDEPVVSENVSVSDAGEVTEESVSADTIEEIADPADKFQHAPCGKSIKKGFLKQHQRFCKQPECNGEV